jgi:hypothetical protein
MRPSVFREDGGSDTRRTIRLNSELEGSVLRGCARLLGQKSRGIETQYRERMLQPPKQQN